MRRYEKRKGDRQKQRRAARNTHLFLERRPGAGARVCFVVVV